MSAFEPPAALLSRAISPEQFVQLRQVLPALGDEILAALRVELPEYRAALEGPDGLGIRISVERAVEAFIGSLEEPGRVDVSTGHVIRRLGEAEFRAGRSLESVQAAWRLGARAAWRTSAAIAAVVGLSSEGVMALAEAIFVYADELAAHVVEGYARAQSDEAGHLDRARRHLARALVETDGWDARVVARAATAARWMVPRRLGVLALADDDAALVASRLDADVLAGSDRGGAWLVVPDPGGPGRMAAIERAVDVATAALSPPVEPHQAGHALRWARRSLAVAGRELPGPAGLQRVADHLADTVVLQDAELAAHFATQRLAPLNAITGVHRLRLEATLASWLGHQRHTPSVAAELHVHPQTVRYRVAQLRELFGDALDTPDGRFELELALRAAAAS